MRSTMLMMSAVLLGLAGCASGDRLMEPQVRAGDRPECLVGVRSGDDKPGPRSMGVDPCKPDDFVGWSSGNRETMDVDFKKKKE